MTEPLPSFTRPPLVEVALAVQLSDGVLVAPELGGAWDAVRRELPLVGQEPPLPPIDESFAPAAPLHVELVHRYPGTRYTLMRADGARLLQVQHDRVALNWRATPAEGYPRYDALRGDFLRYLDVLLAPVAALVERRAWPTWVEVTYVNHVLGEHASCPAEPEEVLVSLARAPQEAGVGVVEDCQVVQRFRLRDDARDIGRLYVQLSPATRAADGRAILVLSLVARVRVAGEEPGAIAAALDVAHERAVRAFALLTRAEIQRQWGRER